MSSIPVFGPPKVGKTVTVASLQMAARNKSDQSLGPFAFVDVTPVSEPSRSLFARAAELVESGESVFEGTRGVETYAFDLELQRSRRWFQFKQPEKESHRFELTDGPGGAVFPTSLDGTEDPADIEAAARRMAHEIREADGCIICLDPGRKDMFMAVFRFLGPVLDTLRLDPKPRRIAIVLTRADDYFSAQGTGAESAATCSSAADCAASLLGHAGINMLKRLQDDGTTVAFGWASAFGFKPDGSCNFNAERGGIDLSADEIGGMEAINAWKPYQVLEPFVFVATGDEVGMEVLR